MSLRNTIKTLIQTARSRRLRNDNSLIKISSETKSALLSLALNSFLCLIDGEVSGEELDEIKLNFDEFMDGMRIDSK